LIDYKSSIIKFTIFHTCKIDLIHTGRLIFFNEQYKSQYPISHTHTSKWTTVYLIKLNIDTYMQFFTACFYHEYWICHTHTLKWQWKVSGIGCCSIKHLMMMSDTVVLLLSTIERRMFFDIYSHKWEKIVKYHLHLQIVHAYRSKIVNYSYLLLLFFFSF